MTALELVVTLADDVIHLALSNGNEHRLPVGPIGLTQRELGGADTIAPEQLTNAIGLVTDHLDDAIRESPELLDQPTTTLNGRLAHAVAHVEVGSTALPCAYRLQRRDAEEVFRTLVAETTQERQHNPGLASEDVHTIIGALCSILAIMRKLDLHLAAILSEDA